jgi:hypothetical protein
MREFVDDKGAMVPAGLRRRKALIQTFVVSTAECERSFNQMNLICVDTRTMLFTDNSSNLLFISINGPPIAQFDVPHAKIWLSAHRSAVDPQSRKRETYTEKLKNFQKWL